MKKILDLIKMTFSEWSEDHASRLAAALSYYTAFSLAPLLVLVITILGLLGIGEAAKAQIIAQVRDLVSPEGAELVQNMIDTARSTSTGVIATIISTITLLFGALGVFSELQNSLDTIWEVKPKPTEGFFSKVRDLFVKRLLSFAMVLVIGFLLLVSLVVSAGLSALNEFVVNTFPIPEFLLLSLNFLVSFAVITFLFAMIFKYLPDAKIAWRDALIGAAVTSLLFTLGKFLIGLYLGSSDVGNSFGAAGSLAIILIWVYYSAQIIFLGAEFTQVYAQQYGSKIIPAEGAEWMSEGERAQQGMPRQQPAPGSMRSGPMPGHMLPATGLRNNYPWRGYSPRRRGLFSKVLFSVTLAMQFIPVLKSLYASKGDQQ
jgi:membrane protein